MDNVRHLGFCLLSNGNPGRFYRDEYPDHMAYLEGHFGCIVEDE